MKEREPMDRHTHTVLHHFCRCRSMPEYEM